MWRSDWPRARVPPQPKRPPLKYRNELLWLGVEATRSVLEAVSARPGAAYVAAVARARRTLRSYFVLLDLGRCAYRPPWDPPDPVVRVRSLEARMAPRDGPGLVRPTRWLRAALGGRPVGSVSFDFAGLPPGLFRLVADFAGVEAVGILPACTRTGGCGSPARLLRAAIPGERAVCATLQLRRTCLRAGRPLQGPPARLEHLASLPTARAAGLDASRMFDPHAADALVPPAVLWHVHGLFVAADPIVRSWEGGPRTDYLPLRLGMWWSPAGPVEALFRQSGECRRMAEAARPGSFGSVGAGVRSALLHHAAVVTARGRLLDAWELPDTEWGSPALRHRAGLVHWPV